MEALLDGRFTLLLPGEALQELAETAASKPHLANKIAPAQLALLHDLLQSVAEHIAPFEGTFPSIGRDRKDDYLIAYAVVGEADYLVTGDKDLLVLGSVGGVTIVTPVYFADLLIQTA
jgi:putative PIN family toxin of toxin-antitoxin system